MPPEKTSFNTLIAKPRVTSEHAIGILKGRYPFLCLIRLRLTADKKTTTKIQQYVVVTITLHNLLIGWDDDDWKLDGSERDDVSTTSAVDEENELNKPIQDGSNSDTRRRQLYSYFCEYVM
jgi:hypothetical protein